nr:hypothetical protein [Tanacetum cinerariifolium]
MPHSLSFEFCLDDLDWSSLILENTLGLGLGLRERRDLCLFSCSLQLVIVLVIILSKDCVGRGPTSVLWGWFFSSPDRISHSGRGLARNGLFMIAHGYGQELPVSFLRKRGILFLLPFSEYAYLKAISLLPSRTVRMNPLKQLMAPSEEFKRRRLLRPEEVVVRVLKYFLFAPSEFTKDPAQRMKTPLVLPWERIPRLDPDVRIRDTVQPETAINTISHEYLLEFTSEYGISEALHPELPGPEDRIVDFPEGKVGVYTRFFEFANFRFPLSQFLFDVLEWMSFSKRPGKNTTQCYTKPLDSLKNWNNRFFWVDERVFLTVMDWRMNAPKDGMPTEGTYSIEAMRALDTHSTPIQKQPEMLLRPRAPHEVPLLTLTANRVIEMDDPAVATDSSGVPSTIERSPLDFALEVGASDQGTAAPKMPPSEDVPETVAPGTNQAEEVAAADPPAAAESHKRGRDGVGVNASSKSLRRDHAHPRPSGSSHGRKSLAAIQLGLASTASVPEDAPTGVSIAAAGDLESKNASSPAEVGSSGSVYRPEWGVTNGSLLDTPEACQDLYNVNLARQVAMGSQLRLRFEQEAKLLKKSVAQVAHRDKRIQARGLEIKNLEALLETEADMKKAAEDKSAGLIKELEDMRARFLDIQVRNEHLSQQVATLQEQVSGEEKLKATFEEFKRYEDDWVERRCAELDARLDALSIDFDEELYPHMLITIAGRRPEAWGRAWAAQLNVESIEAYDPEAEAKFVAALQALKDLKYSLLDQLEGLKDAPIDVIMAALYLESDTGKDAP